MKDLGINKGLVQKFDTSDINTQHVFYGFRKMFRDYLNKDNVGFFDPCCPDSNKKLPVFVDRTTGVLSYLNSTGVQTPIGGGILSQPQNNIAAGAGGAIPITNYLTTINTDAGGDAFTLANGTSIGQLKKIQLIVDSGGNAVITPARLIGSLSTITMDDAGDYVILSWNGTDWVVVENVGSIIA